MILILLGAPGVGKGTQGELIAKEYGIPQISTGDILRKEVKEGTLLGKEAKKYMDSGALVPDNVIIGMMENRIKKDDCKNGFILDGFPRTVAQAEAFDVMLEKNGLELDKVLLIDVPKDEIIDRLTGRRVCSKCGAVYHIKNNPPKIDGVCDKCGGELIQRSDDTKEVVENRLNVYEKSTMPLIEYYEKTKKLVKIDGVGNINEIFSKVKAVLG